MRHHCLYIIPLVIAQSCCIQAPQEKHWRTNFEHQVIWWLKVGKDFSGKLKILIIIHSHVHWLLGFAFLGQLLKLQTDVFHAVILWSKNGTSRRPFLILESEADVWDLTDFQHLSWLLHCKGCGGSLSDPWHPLTLFCYPASEISCWFVVLVCAHASKDMKPSEQNWILSPIVLFGMTGSIWWKSLAKITTLPLSE